MTIRSRVFSVSVFFTRSTGRIGRIIAQTTCPLKSAFMNRKALKNVPSHTGLVFNTPEGKQVFEAHHDTNWVGPTSWEIQLQKKNDDPARRLWVVDLHLVTIEAQDIWERCHNWLGIWDYHAGQLALFYLWRRLRLPVPHDSAKVVCSEAVGRIVHPYFDMTKVAPETKGNHDKLTPASMMQGLHDSGYEIEEVLAKKKTDVPPPCRWSSDGIA